jgi:hypothetical protein
MARWRITRVRIASRRNELFVIARITRCNLRQNALLQYAPAARPSSYRHTISLAIAGLATLYRGIVVRGY